MEFKNTLNLPDPEFTIPMKADLSIREPSQQQSWDEMEIYELLQRERKDAPRFLLHDGPPYTNGPIHIGTAFNKILKDFVLKSRLVMGYRVPYVPGFDNHGLPIEQAVMKKFADKKIVPSKVELRRACREHAAEFIELQTKQFKRLGIFGMWDRPYRTMDYGLESEIVRVFKRLVEAGYIFRGLRPTLWSPTAQTALADTEITYKDVTSKSIYVRFPLLDASQELPATLQGLTNVYAVIWTTTPWTIPANLALAFHPQLQYAVVKLGDAHYLVLNDLVQGVAQKCGWSNYDIVGLFEGNEIEGVQFRHPLFERDSMAVLANYVTTEDGTGIVHTAPGHGRDDFYTGQKYGLPVLCPVDERGILTAEAGEFEGVHYKKCDTVVVDRLSESGNLLAVEDYFHSYPHAERDDQPVIYRATEQWFVKIDHDDLRERMLSFVEHEVQWFPASGKTRMGIMLKGRPDWCISRQRPWGVGIPVFYGKESKTPVLDPVAIEAVAKLVADRGSDAWYECEPHEILPSGYTHPVTGESEFTKEVDVFDVWFDSGSTCFSVLEGSFEPRWKEELPAELYFEGSDQHRGWFNVSMILSSAIAGKPPYKNVVTHEFVNDEKGQKMSKRLGNVIDPVVVCDKYGADILRYWAASVNYEDAVPCGDNLLKVAGDGYRRIRNTLRFLLGNLYDFDPSQNYPLTDVDKWIVEKTSCVVEESLEFYKKYRFNAALSLIHNFCVNEISAFFADAIKDRMYCDSKDSEARRSGQQACFEVLKRLILLTAPIIPHTAEEVYSKLPGEKKSTVFLESLAEEACIMSDDLHQKVETLLSVRAWVFGEFELWKAESGVKDSQDVSATMNVTEAESHHLLHFGPELATIFKMADVEVKVGERCVSFAPSSWLRCERSRIRRKDVELINVDGEQVALSLRDRKVVGL